MRTALLTLLLGLAGAALLPSHRAVAWWDRYRVWHPDMVRPPVVLVPPPAVYAPRPYAPRPYARWVPPHWSRWGRLVPGHWV